MRKLIFLLIFAFSFISPVKAQNCKVLPTCEELGYNKTVSQCAGIEYLTCPFDETKVYCPSTDPCDDYEDKTCTDGCASYYDDCPSKCKTCNSNPCSGYYDCGERWQYCEGSTCPTDSSLCSVYCVDDYFPYECSSSSYCYGIYRDRYCSVPCNEPSDPCDNYPGLSCTDGCASYYLDCPSKCQTCNDPCDNYADLSCTDGCASYYSDCPSKCQTCNSAPEPSDPCDNYTDQSCSSAYGGCKSTYSDCQSKCQSCCDMSDFTDYPYTSCPNNALCISTTCGTVTRWTIESCDEGMELVNSITGPQCLCDVPSGYAQSNYVDCSSPNICSTWICPNGTKYFRVTSCESGYKYHDLLFGTCT